MKKVKGLLKAKPLKIRGAKMAVLAIATTVLIVIVYLPARIYLYSHNLTTVRGDAAIVLGAAVWGEEPSPVFRERINHAINLYKSNQVQNIIFTGGQGESSEPAESIVGRDYAMQGGVSSAHIFTETQSRTTFQNLYYAKREADNRQLTKFLIVSDPLHMKRAILMARDLGMQAYPSPTPTTRYKSLKSKLPFLARETFFYSQYLIGRLVGAPQKNPRYF